MSDPAGLTLWIALGSTAATLVVVDVGRPRAARVLRRIRPRRGSLTAHALADGHVLHCARVPLGSYNVTRAPGLVGTPALGTGALTVLDATGRPRFALTIADAARRLRAAGRPDLNAQPFS